MLCAIRVGQLEGRVVDESVPLGHGVLGQETTGPGGLCFALRTIPVMMELAETMAEHAPDAWLINFTNPAGMVTEAVQRVLGDRAIGICDSPAGLMPPRRPRARPPRRRAVVRLLRPQPPRLAARRARRRPGAAARAAGATTTRSTTFEEGRLFGGEWLRSLEMIPNEYLYYFYYAADTVNAIRQSPESRGAFLLRQQRAFYAEGEQPPGVALESWRGTRHDRERTYMAEARSAAGDGHEHEIDENGGYEGEAMAVLEAIANNTRAVLILNTANRSSLPFLDDRAVVEVPCVVGRVGPGPGRHRRGRAPRARARGDDEGRRAHDDRRGAVGLAPAGDQGACAAPARPVGRTRARRSSTSYCERLPGLAEAFAK